MMPCLPVLALPLPASAAKPAAAGATLARAQESPPLPFCRPPLAPPTP
ncbi:MAG: hypothetical protein ICV73_02765 [Acetobacteraceae bacterium]|nr:hypothetical protein [Acetobacteraceae bacterium]